MDSAICSRLNTAQDDFLQSQLHMLLCNKTLSHLMAQQEWMWAGSPAAQRGQQLCAHKVALHTSPGVLQWALLCVFIAGKPSWPQHFKASDPARHNNFNVPPTHQTS